MEDRAVGLASAAHARTGRAGFPASATKATIRTGSGRCPRRSPSWSGMPRCHLGPRAGPDHGDVRATQRRRLPGRHRPGELALPDGGDRDRGVQHPERAGRRAGGPGSDPYDHSKGVPQPGSARGGRRAGRRRVCHGRPDRRGNSPLGPTRHAGSGRAHPGAAPLPGPGHQVVDGRNRGARRILRRGGQRRARPQRAVPATRRL